jgi:hypothetical protein
VLELTIAAIELEAVCGLAGEFPYPELRQVVRWAKAEVPSIVYLLSIGSWLGNGAPLCQGRTWPNWTSSP